MHKQVDVLLRGKHPLQQLPPKKGWAYFQEITVITPTHFNLFLSWKVEKVANSDICVAYAIM